MKKIIVAIDGYSSCGKSTIAKALAKHAGYTYVDTGAMYRAIGLYTLRDKVPVGIFGGELVIDFSEISGYLDELLGDTWGQEEDGQ